MPTLLPGRNYYRMHGEQHNTMANTTIDNKTLLIFQRLKNFFTSESSGFVFNST